MKKRQFGLLLAVILGLAACKAMPMAEEPKTTYEPAMTSTTTVEPEKTVTPETTGTPGEGTTAPTEGTEDITPTLTATPKPTNTPTPKPTATPTPRPTNTPTPKPTATPTPKPTATLTPKPTNTPTPKPTATPIPTKAPTGVSEEISRLLAEATIHENTRIRGEVCTSEQEANEYVRQMSLTYSSFSVIVEEASYLHSVKEYKTLYPEIERMTLDKIDIYINGICLVFSDVETVYDANLCYAMRTGNMSVLSDTEKQVYDYVKNIVETTGVKKMDRVEAVRTLHDYLVLQLKYDETYRSISHTPEGVMKNKTAVCDGYARTMRLLLLLTGIECDIVTGSGRGESHAWNLVKMEDGWYHVDVTWDDPLPDVEGKVSYGYFLKNDAHMAKDHSWESEISCTGNAYQIYMYREVLCDSAESLREVYDKQIQTEKTLTFCYPKGGTLTEETILEFVMNQVQRSISYYPETETEDYLILEITNPLY